MQFFYGGIVKNELNYTSHIALKTNRYNETFITDKNRIHTLLITFGHRYDDMWYILTLIGFYV